MHIQVSLEGKGPDAGEKLLEAALEAGAEDVEEKEEEEEEEVGASGWVPVDRGSIHGLIHGVRTLIPPHRRRGRRKSPGCIASLRSWPACARRCREAGGRRGWCSSPSYPRCVKKGVVGAGRALNCCA